MKMSLQIRLTLMITLFVALSLIFFTGLTLLNNNLQLDMLTQNPTDTTLELETTYLIPNGESTPAFPTYIVVNSQQWFNKITLVSMLVFILAAAFIAYFLSRKALAPIVTFREEVQQRHLENLNAPFSANKKTPREILALQQSFQQMSQRVVDTYALQRRFTNNAAHELRTPIATMKTGLQMLLLTQNDLSPAELAATLNTLQKQNDRLAETVNSLEMLSQAETLQKEVFAFSELLQTLLTEFQSTIAQKELTLHSSGDAVLLYGQKKLLYHSFRNLLDNAIKYAAPQTTIQLHWRQTHCFSFTIENQGPAIPEKDQPHIFQAFYRSDDSRSRDTGGSGLGLTLSENIIASHGGDLKLIKSDTTGTKFAVILPRSEK